MAARLGHSLQLPGCRTVALEVWPNVMYVAALRRRNWSLILCYDTIEPSVVAEISKLDKKNCIIISKNC